MAGFRKAKSEQAALKMGIFGPAGSGKTFTTLLLAEGLARVEGKRVGFIDTEHGTDFYAQHVPTRQFHPEAFDFDAIYTRSITEVVKECRAVNPLEHGVVVIDSMTHLWEAAVNSYTGPRSGGKIPFHAWGKIKEPYKRLMEWMINCPLHVIILGRQANEWGQDDETGESISTGVKMKAEGETGYEPHILTRMEGVKPFRADGKTVSKNAVAVPTMFVIKDRTGVLQGKAIEYPTFDSVCAPLLPLLGKVQAQVESDDDAMVKDATAIAEAERAKAERSEKLRREYLAKFELARGKPDEIAALAKTITPAVKKEMTPNDLTAVRNAWVAASEGKPAPAADHCPAD